MNAKKYELQRQKLIMTKKMHQNGNFDLLTASQKIKTELESTSILVILHFSVNYCFCFTL